MIPSFAYINRTGSKVLKPVPLTEALMNTRFPLGTPLCAGVPFIFESRVAPHPHTAKAKDFIAYIWWNWMGHDVDANLQSITVVDSTPWLPTAPQNVVVVGLHTYATPGSKTIKVEMLPQIPGNAKYDYLFGGVWVNPNPGLVTVAQKWVEFTGAVNHLTQGVDSSARAKIQKSVQSLQGR